MVTNWSFLTSKDMSSHALTVLDFLQHKLEQDAEKVLDKLETLMPIEDSLVNIWSVEFWSGLGVISNSEDFLMDSGGDSKREYLSLEVLDLLQHEQRIDHRDLATPWLLSKVASKMKMRI